MNKEVKNNKLNQVGGYPPTTKVAGFPASSIMKSKDLMIGDWVFLIKENIIAEIVGIKCDARYLADEAVVTIMHNGKWYDVDLNHLLPIPLTTGILQNNGFEKHYDDDIIIYSDANGIEVEMGINYKLSEDGYFYLRGILHKLYYVHELQHALRLCDIKKEIML